MHNRDQDMSLRKGMHFHWQKLIFIPNQINTMKRMWFGVFRLFLFFSLFCYFTKAIQMYCKKKIKKSVILQRRITKYSFQAFWRKLKWNMINNFASLYKTASTLQVWINVELLCCDEEQGLLNPEVFNLIHSRFSWESISSTQLFPLQVGSWILCAKKKTTIIWVEKKKFGKELKWFSATFVIWK